MTTTLDPRTRAAEQSVSRRPNRIGGGVIVAAVAILVSLPFVGTDTVVDESHQFAETQRMQALAPAQVIDTPSRRTPGRAGRPTQETAELRRFQTLAPKPDESHQFAETQRMQALAPGADNSYQYAETQRMQALAPAPSVDTSWETAELRRMLALQP